MILKTLEILQKVKNNELTNEQAQKLIEQPLDYATIDYDRKKRTGNHEVIYCAGKTKEQINGIVKNMLDHDINSILITRVDQEKSEAILKEFPQMIYDSLSHICYIDEDQKEINKGKIVVVCAGTSDLPVAREAMLTAQFLGNEVELVSDVGVAGIHRLFHRLDTIQRANVLVVCAGMEGDLWINQLLLYQHLLGMALTLMDYQLFLRCLIAVRVGLVLSILIMDLGQDLWPIPLIV